MKERSMSGFRFLDNPAIMLTNYDANGSCTKGAKNTKSRRLLLVHFADQIARKSARLAFKEHSNRCVNTLNRFPEQAPATPKQ